METSNSKRLICDVDEFPERKGQAIVLAIQHILAMFVACITVPLIVFSGYTLADGTPLTSAMIPPTLVAAAVGTAFYLVMTKFKSPMFLASSFAYLAPMCAAVATGAVTTATGAHLANLWMLPIGMAMVGIVYVIVALLIAKFGVKWLNHLLPPIVIGPVIMVIGLSLAGSAVNNLTGTASGDYNLIKILCGLCALMITGITARWGKGFISIIPFVMGMVGGYVIAAIFTAIGYHACGNEYFKVIDWAPIVNNFVNADCSFRGIQAFIDIPKFLFLAEVNGDAAPFDWAQLGQAAALFIPVSLVTICEHIGDHKNMSNIIDRDLLTEPGLSRTLIGDGVATALSGVICGAANTTYGENVAVVGVTKIASTKVILLACAMTFLLAFISPIMAFTTTIPACITGGVSLILYGFIANSGIRMLINSKVDMSKNANIFIASTILVAGIGGLVLDFGGITITSTAVAMILGIIMNGALYDRDRGGETDMLGNEIPSKEEKYLETKEPEAEPVIEEQKIEEPVAEQAE